MIDRRENDRRYYLRHRSRILRKQAVYAQTEQGREVSRRASRKCMNKRGYSPIVAQRSYRTIKQDPKAYVEYLRRYRAMNAVRYALRVGKLIKGRCEVCKSKNVHAHHNNYNKPLEIRWLCPLHHGATRHIA